MSDSLWHFVPCIAALQASLSIPVSDGIIDSMGVSLSELWELVMQPQWVLKNILLWKISHVQKSMFYSEYPYVNP